MVGQNSRLVTGIHAGGGDSEASPVSEMSTEKACSVLEVSKDAGFEEVLQAKRRLTGSLAADSQRAREVGGFPFCAGYVGLGCDDHRSCLLAGHHTTCMFCQQNLHLSE